MVSLVCGGAVIAATEVSVARAQASGDLQALRLLIAGEHLAIELYERASAGGGLPAPLAVWIEGALGNERDHEAALLVPTAGVAIGAVHLADPSAVMGASAVLRVALALETALVGAYLGSVETLASPELRGMAAAIGANEAQHLAAVRRLIAARIVPDPALAPAVPPLQARRALAAEAAGSQIPG